MELAIKKRPIIERLTQVLTDDREMRLSRETAAGISLETQIKECVAQMKHNQMRFDLETEPELIDELIYEYQAIQSRYRYLQRKARAQGLRAIL